MKHERGDFTVGDVGVSIQIVADSAMSANIDFLFVKPNGNTIIRDATSVSSATATYTWASGDLDEAGQWHVYLKDVTTGYTYNENGPNSFTVRPKPESMARN